MNGLMVSAAISHDRLTATFMRKKSSMFFLIHENLLHAGWPVY